MKKEGAGASVASPKKASLSKRSIKPRPKMREERQLRLTLPGRRWCGSLPLNLTRKKNPS